MRSWTSGRSPTAMVERSESSRLWAANVVAACGRMRVALGSGECDRVSVNLACCPGVIVARTLWPYSGLWCLTLRAPCGASGLSVWQKRSRAL
eukprot:4990355-Prymnesium_polylepis.1